jgi:hypothetical protein
MGSDTMNTYRLSKETHLFAGKSLYTPAKGYAEIDVETSDKEFLNFIDKKLDEAIKEFKETHQ